MTFPQIPKSPGLDLSRVQPIDCPLQESRRVDWEDIVKRGQVLRNHAQLHEEFLREVEAKRVNEKALKVLNKGS